MHVMCHMRRIHACHVSYEEEDTCMSHVICGGGYMPGASNECVGSVSYEEEDTCMSHVI
jgi:hypothetical protein